MAQLPAAYVNHSRKVCALYKKTLRFLANYKFDPLEYRYEAVLMREKFDQNRNIKDLRVAKKLLDDAEKQLLEDNHHQPLKFPESPGGVAYKREVDVPDALLDYWHPMEKAMYPKYFARREQLKKEYEEWYYKTYPDVKRDSSK